MFQRRIIYVILGIALFIFLAWFFSNIFVYITISVIFAAILRGPANYISQISVFGWQIPRVLAVIFSFLVLLLVVFLFVVTFIPLVSDQINVLSNLNYDKLFKTASEPIIWLEEFLINNNLTTEAKGFIIDSIKESFIGFITRINVSNLLNTLVGFTGSLFIGILAVAFITFFLLYEKGMVRRQFNRLIPNSYFEVTITAITKIERLLTNYLVGLLLQMTAIFTVASVGLSIFGVKYAITIALFAALANLIPYVGPIMGASFGILIGLSTHLLGNGAEGGSLLILIFKICAVFAIVQIMDNIIFQPLIFSKSVKAHPLEIFVIIFVGANLAGVVGMIAAIPVYTVLRVTVLEFYRGYNQYYVFKNN
ncbi:AI-2E family transporter [Marinigracilibium pacificum]|uniref:AI-2E family transporter n=1 Tax=Marinigracilibium pacificum TaxID=2729599 RepID=A0A848J3U2_9BACT|nr:AI-2E family transporter [Marinigracilibium pacificum]NMM49200.1 AI-2E family transporter [Marinigracilibium pacificum]